MRSEECGLRIAYVRTRVLDFIRYFNQVLGKPFRWTLPGRDVGDVRNPELVQRLGLELSMNLVLRTQRPAVMDCRAYDLTATTARKPCRRINRSTVQRATDISSRANWYQTLSAP